MMQLTAADRAVASDLAWALDPLPPPFTVEERDRFAFLISMAVLPCAPTEDLDRLYRIADEHRQALVRYRFRKPLMDSKPGGLRRVEEEAS